VGEAEAGQWLTLAELANRTGRHIDAVRSWAHRGRRAGRLRMQKNNRHELQVWFTPELEPELVQGIASAASVGGEDEIEALAQLRSRLEDTAESLAEARIGQARLEGELVAEARRSADLVAALERERERGDRLAAELAEARRPVLLRLLEALRRR
jgi:hypothetical protein